MATIFVPAKSHRMGIIALYIAKTLRFPFDIWGLASFDGH